MATTFIPWLPEALQATFQWKTDVRRMADGTEQRGSVWNHPRVTFTMDYMLVEDLQDSERRSLRTKLVSAVQDTFSIPLRHEGSFLTAGAASAATVINLNWNRAIDWLGVNRKIYLELEENEAGFEMTVQSVSHVGSNAEVTLTVGLPQAVTIDWKVSPVVELQPTSKQVLGSFRAKEAGGWSITGIMQTMYMFNQGTGITLTEYEDLPVFDRPASQNSDDQIGEEFDAGLVLDGEPLVSATTLYDQALIRRDLGFTVDDVDEWRWWKAFLFTVTGQRQPFFRSTFRRDLDLDAQPTSPTTTLVVSDEPDYLAWWTSTHTFRRLALTMSDDTVALVLVTDVEDNLDGTLTLTLHDELTRGALTIDNIAFLETTRLGADEVVLTCSNGTDRVSIQTLTGNWKRVPGGMT